MPTTPVPVTVAEHAQATWYNPPRDPSTRYAIERDLNPILTDEEGGGDLHSVLEVSFQPPTGQSGLTASNWAGLTQSLSTVDRDFSSLRYLEIWVNDFTPNHALTQAKLHIDLGQVSEDAFWDPSNPPNGRLDTEDKNGDGRLDINSSNNTIDEDTGLDGIHDVDEPGYNPPLDVDPNHDDYAYDRNNAGDYSRINNTERNAIGDPNARVDTEDLDRDGYLGTQNNYFEATIDLADTNYVAIDVPRDYANNPDVVGSIRADNGWRLFRIPMSGAAFKSVNFVSWDYIPHVRLWLNAMAGPVTIQIGGIDPVGVAFNPTSSAAQCRAYPNPAAAAVAFSILLPKAGHARLRLYDLRGRLVKELFDESMGAGSLMRVWDGKDARGHNVASGLYLYRLEAPGSNASGRVVFVR